MDGFRFDEKYLFQIPALQVLVNLGYQYLTSAEALAARGGKVGNVLLEEILREQMKKLNRIQHKGGTYLFSEENIQIAIQWLKNVKYDDLRGQSMSALKTQKRSLMQKLLTGRWRVPISASQLEFGDI